MTRLLPALLASALLACATRPPAPPKPEPPPTYGQRLLERVEAAAGREVHQLRYNPGLCGCPPFELELEGRWTRTTFDVSDDGHPVLVSLREAVKADDDADRLGTYTVQGKLLERITTCGQGALFVTLDPLAYGPLDTEVEPEVETEVETELSPAPLPEGSVPGGR